MSHGVKVKFHNDPGQCVEISANGDREEANLVSLIQAISAEFDIAVDFIARSDVEQKEWDAYDRVPPHLHVLVGYVEGVTPIQVEMLRETKLMGNPSYFFDTNGRLYGLIPALSGYPAFKHPNINMDVTIAGLCLDGTVVPPSSRATMLLAAAYFGVTEA